MHDPKRLIKGRTVRAKLGGISASTFWRLRKRGFPAALQLPGSTDPIWDEASVDAWIANREPYQPKTTQKALEKAKEAREQARAEGRKRPRRGRADATQPAQG